MMGKREFRVKRVMIRALLDVQTAVDTGASDITFENVHLLRPKKNRQQVWQ